jgi:hypothetical protein
MKVSAADLDELKDAAANEGKDNVLVFPGLSIWKSDLSDCVTTKGGEMTVVEFTLKGASFYKANDKDFCISRLIANVESFDEKENKCVLADNGELSFNNISDWAAKFGSGAVVAATTPADPAGKDPKADDKADAEPEAKAD